MAVSLVNDGPVTIVLDVDPQRTGGRRERWLHPARSLGRELTGRLDRVRPLLDAPSPAVLVTYRKDGSAHTSPVWFRWHDGAFEVVIAEGDMKLRHLATRRECVLLVFETVPPFRGIEVRGAPELVEGDVTAARREIAGRYLGEEPGGRFAAERPQPGVLLRLTADEPRVWDLASILPV